MTCVCVCAESVCSCDTVLEITFTSCGWLALSFSFQQIHSSDSSDRVRFLQHKNRPTTIWSCIANNNNNNNITATTTTTTTSSPSSHHQSHPLHVFVIKESSRLCRQEEVVHTAPIHFHSRRRSNIGWTLCDWESVLKIGRKLRVESVLFGGGLAV